MIVTIRMTIGTRCRTSIATLCMLASSLAFAGDVEASNATDVAPDRILVTVDADSLSIGTLSPSGRLEYAPPSDEAIRAVQLRRARAIADEFSLRLEEDWPIPALDVYCFVFRLADPARRDHVIAALSQHPDVESAQALNFFHTENDPLNRTDDTLATGSQRLHALATGRDVRVAVIDTGADLAHEDLSSAHIAAVDFVGDAVDDQEQAVPVESHGTTIIGMIAAGRDNGMGISGYAPDAAILLLRACWQPQPGDERAVCNSFTLAKALSYALEADVAIVNLSISGPRDLLLERLGELLVAHDTLVVAAGESRETFPASIAGSLIAQGLLPGTERFMTLLPDDRYGLRSGSSLDAARITGIAALLQEIAPEIGRAGIQKRLNRLREEPADAVFADLLGSRAKTSDSNRRAVR